MTRKARKVCVPVRQTLDLTKTESITCIREVTRRGADWRMGSRSGEAQVAKTGWSEDPWVQERGRGPISQA